MGEHADELKSRLFGPLWVFSKHPDDLARYAFVEELVTLGYTIVKRDPPPDPDTGLEGTGA
jgi:hypothetical protein